MVILNNYCTKFIILLHITLLSTILSLIIIKLSLVFKISLLSLFDKIYE